MAVLLQLLSKEQLAQLNTKEWDILHAAVENEINTSEKVQKVLKARVDQTLKDLKRGG
jgi:hypothetical protein